MQLRFFGGLAADAESGPVSVRGRGRRALLLRLAIDAGTTVSYRALTDDLWPREAPDDPRAALQSLASRLRRDLPPDIVTSEPGGYRLDLARENIDLTRFQDLVTEARHVDDPGRAAALARQALSLWTGDPWTPEDGFEWIREDLIADRAHALRLDAAGAASLLSVDPPATDGLPAPLTTLVGRLPELDLIAAQLRANRLVTLLGPGGAGKTTLALETARRLPGALFVELAPVGPGEVWGALNGAVGRSVRVPDSGPTLTSTRDRTLAALAGRDVVLVIDNCEHVADEAASIVDELLRALPRARVLATSREPVGVPGEAFVDLGPLPAAEATRLFDLRLRSARGAAAGTDELAMIERITTRLDGLPLAIELAAAKARTLSLAEIESGLDDRFTLLRGSSRVGEARHQTLRALIDWSWDTLSSEQRRALVVAAVFPDGIGAADAVEIATAFAVTADDFDALVDRSLLRRVDGRFRMLETVRDYGRDRMVAEGWFDAAERTRAEVLARIALRHDARTRGTGAREAVAWFDANEDNLASSTRWCAATGERAIGVALARAQMWAWFIRERFEEITAAIEAFSPRTADPDDLASEADVLLAAMGWVAEAMRSEAPSAAELAARAVAIGDAARRHPSELTLVLPSITGSMVDALTVRTGEFERFPAWSMFQSVDETGLETAPEWTRAFLSLMQAASAQNDGDLAGLEHTSERALSMFRRLGDPWGAALASQLRSEWLLLNGRLDDALHVTDEAAALVRGLASAGDVAQVESRASLILLRMGRIDDAQRRLERISRSVADNGDERMQLHLACVLAVFALATGAPQKALESLQALLTTDRRSSADQLIAWAYTTQAQALLVMDRADEARDSLRLAMTIAWRTGDKPIVAGVIATVAAWLAAAGDPDRARRVLAISDRIRGTRDETDPFLRDLRARLHDRSGASGEELSLDAPDLREMLALLE